VDEFPAIADTAVHVRFVALVASYVEAAEPNVAIAATIITNTSPVCQENEPVVVTLPPPVRSVADPFEYATNVGPVGGGTYGSRNTLGRVRVGITAPPNGSRPA
jgi:hypothetical protein